MPKNTAFYKQVLDNLYDGVYFLDGARKITYWNRGAEKVTGYRAEEVIGLGCSEKILMHIDENGTQLCEENCPAQKTLQDGQHREMELYLHHKNGYRLPVRTRIDPIVDGNGAILGVVEIFSDNSSGIALRQQMSELQKLALFDHLTEIGNRRYAEINLYARFNEKKRYGWKFGVLFADLDHFKLVNDTYGHEVGDRVLTMVAKTLTSNIRSFDVVSRWGGEEFVVVLVNIDPEGLIAVGNKLRTLIAQSSLYVGSEQVRVTVSIGGTLVRGEDTTDSLIQRADGLMYQSKKDGRNRLTTG